MFSGNWNCIQNTFSLYSNSDTDSEIEELKNLLNEFPDLMPGYSYLFPGLCN